MSDGLRVRVLPPPSAPTAGTLPVHAVLRDTSMEDVEHPTVAEVHTEMSADGTTELFLPVQADTLDPRNRYSLWVHAGTGDLERLTPGDLITTTALPVEGDDVRQQREIVVTLQQI
jgi:hypothetical protein